MMKVLITLLLSTYLVSVYGQRTISGTVIDETGHPVPFATILSNSIKTNGTSADGNGNFKLEGIFDHDTLICTHINYQTRKEEIWGNNKIIFRLIKPFIPSTFLSIDAISTSTASKQPTKIIIKDSSLRLEEDEKKIFQKVEIKARFGNDVNSLKRYFERNIVYPDSTSVPFDAFGEFEGMVVARFTVSKTGNVINALILKGVNGPVDQAVLNAITAMPLWEPAIQNGRQVDSEQEISVYFNVQQKVYRQ